MTVMPVFPKFDYENNDITKIKMQDFCLLQNPQDPEQLAVLKSKTPARIAIGHTGARYPLQGGSGSCSGRSFL